MSGMKKPTCPYCGSTEVHREALVEFYEGEWRIYDIYDYYHCGDCHEEFNEANWVDEGVEDE